MDPILSLIAEAAALFLIKYSLPLPGLCKLRAAWPPAVLPFICWSAGLLYRRFHCLPLDILRPLDALLLAYRPPRICFDSLSASTGRRLPYCLPPRPPSVRPLPHGSRPWPGRLPVMPCRVIAWLLSFRPYPGARLKRSVGLPLRPSICRPPGLPCAHLLAGRPALLLRFLDLPACSAPPGPRSASRLMKKRKYIQIAALLFGN